MTSLPQSFHRLSVTSYKELPEERFQYFIDTVSLFHPLSLPPSLPLRLSIYHLCHLIQLLPKLRKVSPDHLCVFIPSYFDFVRVRNYLKKEGFSFAQLCEYTTSPNISRARHNFYLAKRQILLYTERLHFYRRSADNSYKYTSQTLHICCFLSCF